MKIFYRVSEYDQWLEIVQGKIIKFSCSCMRGSLWPDQECKHIIKIKRFMDKNIEWLKD